MYEVFWVMTKAGACGLGIQFPHTDLFVNTMVWAEELSCGVEEITDFELNVCRHRDQT